MMRIIIILFYCIFISNFAYARVDDASISELNPLSYPHLTDTNQSQIFEPMSSIEHFPKLAAVHFITGSSGQTFDTQENDFADPSGEYCQRYGFTVTSCPSGLFNQACPYNDKIYDKCCDAAYTYTSATCSTPKQLSADTCGGKHRCYCDTAAYPYASCDSPQIKGEACADESGTRYKTCVCPSPASDTGYGCESYYAAPCGSVCSKYYADNCRNRTHNDYGYGCAKYWDDCAAKCETPYTDNCRNRNAVSAPYGCQQYYSDCQSKCEIAYSDNCRNRTAVISSCPSNATCQTYSDCSSKISSWSCNSGYNQSGNSCVTAKPTCAEYAKTHSGVVLSYSKMEQILTVSGSPEILTHRVVNSSGGSVEVDVLGESVTVSECRLAPTSDTCYVCSCDYIACDRIMEESCRVDGGSYYGYDSWVDCADYVVQMDCDENIYYQCTYYRDH